MNPGYLIIMTCLGLASLVGDMPPFFAGGGLDGGAQIQLIPLTRYACSRWKMAGQCRLRHIVGDSDRRFCHFLDVLILDEDEDA